MSRAPPASSPFSGLDKTSMQGIIPPTLGKLYNLVTL